MKKIIKYSLHILGWIILGITAIVFVLIMLIQTTPAKKRIAHFASLKASSFVNGKITIGGIEGIFFSQLILQDILVTHHVDTLAHIAEINTQYNLWPLLNGELQIQHLAIEEPSVYLSQVNDSTWNLQNLTKPSTTQDPDTSSSSKPLAIFLSLFELNNGTLHIQSGDTLIPRKIGNLHTNLSLTWTEEKQAIQLNDFSFYTQKPDFILQSLSLNLTRTKNLIALKNLHVKTAQNGLDAAGTYQDKPNNKATAELQSSPVQLQEFEFFFPGIQIPAAPVLTFDASAKNNAISANIELKNANQRILLDVESSNLIPYLLNEPNTILDYKLQVSFENIDVANWSGTSNLDYLINGNLLVDGLGITPESAHVKAEGDFNNCTIEDQKVDWLNFSLNLDNGNITGLAKGKGNFGAFELQPIIRNITKTPDYNINLTTHQLDLGQLTGNDSLQSDLNIKALINGVGIAPKTMQAHANIKISKSYLYGLALDTLLANIKYGNENLTIDTLHVATSQLNLSASGNYSLNAASHIDLHANVNSISAFSRFLPKAEMDTHGQIHATLWGIPDSLHLQTAINLMELKYNSLVVGKIQINADALLSQNDTLVSALLHAEQIKNNAIILDSVMAEFKAEPDSISVNAHVAGMDAYTHVNAGVKIGNTIKISLLDWVLDYKNQHLQLQQAPATILIDSTNYRVNNFKMASNNSDTAQYISAQGQISRIGEEDFRLKLANISMNEIAQLFNLKIQTSGTLDANLNLTGNADAPLLQGGVKWNKAVLNSYHFTDFGATIDYQQNKLQLKALIIPHDSGRIELAGSMPVQLALDSFKIDYSTKDTIDALLRIQKFPLRAIKSFLLADQVKGYLQGEVQVSGTTESPNPKGNIGLSDALIKIPEYGIDYRDILFTMRFLNDKIQLDTLNVKSADGDLKGKGVINFVSDFYKGDINNSSIALQFNRFNPVNHRQFNIQLSGKANVGGKKGDVVFGGDLTIPKAGIYLPAIINMMSSGGVSEIPKPILIREMEQMNISLDTLTTQKVDSVHSDTISFDYFNYLTGKVQLTIPKNTWIKSEDMHIELSGDLELIKHRNFFELFGSVEVVRGQYDLLGKTFVINEGTISFQGGEELIPQMNIKASYTFRNTQKVEQNLSVEVGGTSEEPSVDFALDGSSISEGDALSYILFGKGMNELSIDQQENVSGNNDIAKSAAASILSSQLTNFLGNKLNVDYIEVKSDGGFDKATVLVGKYITNDLFVSYEQRLGETDEQDMSKYEVKMEYELFRFLFFQLNNSSKDSGFDVIFKFDSK